MDLALPPGMIRQHMSSMPALVFALVPVLALTPALPAFAGAAAEIEELPGWRLRPGETRTLALDRIDRYSVGGTAVRAAPVPASERSLLLKAVAPGASELWVWRKDSPTLHLSIVVSEAASDAERRSPDPLDTALEPLREARPSRAGDRVILRGKVETEAELSRIHAIEDAFPRQVENQTETSLELLEGGRARIGRWIDEQRLSGALRIEVLGGTLWVRGSAPDLPTRTSWEQKLRSLFAGARLDISALPDSSRTLFFRVFLLELKKSAFRQLGLDWPSHLSGVLKVEGGSLFWSSAPEIELTLRWLEGKGWARVLSQPELVVRVPGEAELFNGGEIPLEVRSRNGHRSGSWIDWKPYGLILRLKALHSTAEQVRLEISSEISELDRANGTDQIPALQSSRLRTQVDARIGEPLFLSGLLQEKTGSQQRGWPLLGSIPVLGRLFGSEDFVKNRSELVAVLVPLNAPPPAPSWVPRSHEPVRGARLPDSRLESSDETSAASPTAPTSASPGNRFLPLLERRFR